MHCSGTPIRSPTKCPGEGETRLSADDSFAGDQVAKRAPEKECTHPKAARDQRELGRINLRGNSRHFTACQKKAGCNNATGNQHERCEHQRPVK